MSKLEVDAIEPQSGTTLTIGASGDTVTIASGASFASIGIDDNATSTAITIDSSENVGIGTASPSSLNESANNLVIGSGSGNEGLTIYTGTSDAGCIFFADGTSGTDEYKGSVQYEHNNDAMTFSTDATERVRINSSGNVGIGTSSPASLGANITTLEMTGGSTIRQGGIYLSNSDKSVKTYFYGTDTLTVLATESNIPLAFSTNNTERMRIDTTGRVAIGKTPDDSFGVAGCEFNPAGYLVFNRNGQMAYFNRPTTDGALVEFRQAGTAEGNISVSGATVSYNGFTGTHWSRFIDNSKPTILRGTVLESLDEMCDWYNLEFDVTTQDDDGNDVITTKKVPHVLTEGQSVGDTINYNHEGIDVQATIVKETDIKHVKSKVSDTVDAKNVYGVFVAYDEDGEGYNDFYVASVGSFVVRIKANETIAKGDLLQSNGDGTAKVQTDDAIRASTFAKVLSTTIIETYEDGSYLVPCSLMC